MESLNTLLRLGEFGVLAWLCYQLIVVIRSHIVANSERMAELELTLRELIIFLKAKNSQRSEDE